MKIPTDKYRYCNHYHEIGDRHEMVDFGDGEFVANKEAIPLLKALNELGLKTRSHHIDDKEHAWVAILLDEVDIEVRTVYENHSDRTKYNGKKELLITWKKHPTPDDKKTMYRTGNYRSYRICAVLGGKGAAIASYSF